MTKQTFSIGVGSNGSKVDLDVAFDFDANDYEKVQEVISIITNGLASRLMYEYTRNSPYVIREVQHNEQD